jgi:hypothetical protein
MYVALKRPCSQGKHPSTIGQSDFPDARGAADGSCRRAAPESSFVWVTQAARHHPQATRDQDVALLYMTTSILLIRVPVEKQILDALTHITVLRGLLDEYRPMRKYDIASFLRGRVRGAATPSMTKRP